MRFILIDQILEMIPGQEIVAVKDIGPEEEFFRDHFPGFPVVPGVLLTEMMAQTAGKCLDAERLSRGKAMLAQIRSASFRDWVVPGNCARIHARIKTNQSQYAIASCRVEVDHRNVAQAELLFSFLPLERLAPGYRDDILADFLEPHAEDERGEHA